MIKKYTGFELGKDLIGIRIPGVTGDGIRMAWEAGAMPTEMNVEMIYWMVEPTEPDPVLYETFRQPHLMVNLLGERFIGEDVLPNTTFTGNAISRQKNRIAFTIFDEALKKRYQTIGLDEMGPMFPILKAEDFDRSLQRVFDRGYKEFFVADSIEELAAKTGIDAKRLAQTIDEYNGFCDAGWDPVFNKHPKLLRPIRTPRFYAARQHCGAYGTLGGIKINHRTEVVDKEWRIIPGLYAAGTDANAIYGDSYVFILPGNTMGFAVNTGRMAGENAVDYVKSQA
jgi:fumarate reductase flavoprotein subunit